MTAFLAEAYLHAIDPVIVDLGLFSVRWYGVSYLAGFIVAWLLVWWFARSGRSPLSPQTVGDLMFYMVIGVLVGGRLGYVFFYDQRLLIDFSAAFPFWGVLAINRGGMASHGGVIGVVLAAIVFGRKYNIKPLHLIDMGALFCTPGLFFGRLANFINGELWGRALPASAQPNPPGWSIKYPQEIVDRWFPALRQGEQKPDQYAASLARAAEDMHITAPADELRAVVVPEIERRLSLIEQQLRPFMEVDANFYDRLMRIASDSSDLLHDQVVQTISPLLTAYYPSQIFQAISDGPVLFGILAIVWLRPRKPGVIGGTFLIAYGVLRIITEMFRQPDEGVAMTFNLLSRGQTLSALMILAGIALVMWSARREAPRMGGLLRRV